MSTDYSSIQRWNLKRNGFDLNIKFLNFYNSWSPKSSLYITIQKFLIGHVFERTLLASCNYLIKNTFIIILCNTVTIYTTRQEVHAGIDYIIVKYLFAKLFQLFQRALQPATAK